MALDRARAAVRRSLGADELAEAHRALLDDPELVGETHALTAEGKSAAYAWRAASRTRAEPAHLAQCPARRARPTSSTSNGR